MLSSFNDRHLLVTRWSALLWKHVRTYCETFTHIIFWIFFFPVISMESSPQIMLPVWKCWRFSRKPQKQPSVLISLRVPQPVSLWYVYVKTQITFFLFCFPGIVWNYIATIWSSCVNFLGEGQCKNGWNSCFVGQQAVAIRAGSTGPTGRATGRENGWHLFWFR